MPMPEFDLTALNQIAQFASNLVDLVNANGFLWFLAGVTLATGVLTWAIKTVDQPPRF